MALNLIEAVFKGRPFILQDGADPTREATVDANGRLAVQADVTVSSIAAGTNNIGDVDVLSIAAGDNNIGNVDIVTMPDAHAARQTLYSISGTTTAIGNTQVVVPPEAGQSHYVVAFVIQNEAATANTLRLMDSTAAKWRCFCQNQGDGLAMSFAAGREWKVGNAQPIMLNLSAATVVGYSLMYYTAGA